MNLLKWQYHMMRVDTVLHNELSIGEVATKQIHDIPLNKRTNYTATTV